LGVEPESIGAEPESIGTGVAPESIGVAPESIGVEPLLLASPVCCTGWTGALVEEQAGRRDAATLATASHDCSRTTKEKGAGEIPPRKDFEIRVDLIADNSFFVERP
jgi:hypothetical protein